MVIPVVPFERFSRKPHAPTQGLPRQLFSARLEWPPRASDCLIRLRCCIVIASGRCGTLTSVPRNIHCITLDNTLGISPSHSGHYSLVWLPCCLASAPLHATPSARKTERQNDLGPVTGTDADIMS